MSTPGTGTDERTGEDVPRARPGLPAAVIARNVRLIQRDAVAMGVVNSSAPFLPVLLLRLGGTTLQVSLLAALPAIAGFLFAIPLGRMLQRRRDVIPWYSTCRLLAQLAFAAMAAAILVFPSGRGWAAGAAPAVLAVLAIWALQTVPNTVGNVTFPLVMDGVAGSSRRFDLLSRRWSIMGVTTAIVVAAAGQTLGLLAFPMNYALVFAGFSAAGAWSWWYAHRFRLPDQEVPSVSGSGSPRRRVAELSTVLRAQPRFLTFEVRSFLYTASVYMATPLMPLYYVRVVHAPDAWIGIIGACTAGTQLLGFVGWRRVSLRRGIHWVVLATVLGSALAPAALTLLGSLPLVALLAAVGAVFGAGASLVLFDELMQRVPRRHAVTFTAVDQSAQNLAATFAPLLGGIVAVQFGIRVGLILSAALGVASFLLFAAEGRGILGRFIPARFWAPAAGEDSAS